jgi:starch-binding outer membrane protein, SusD/RagB family
MPTTSPTNSRSTVRWGANSMRNRIFTAAVCAGALTGCKQSDLNLLNPNSATITGANADPTALQLTATGLLSDYRGIRTGQMSGLGRIGRESYVFTPQEGRNTTHYLIGITVGGKQELDPSGFITATWSYSSLRDNFNFRNAVSVNASLTATQKSAALGFAKTLEAATMLEIIITTDTLGAITQILADPTQSAPFVSRDSVYKYILASLDSAKTALAAGGPAFPFALHSGFAGFNTPATFLQFTNAIEARAAADYAPIGGGAAAWQKAQTALAASFLNMSATSAAGMNVGVYHIYSSATGDQLSGLDPVTNTTLYAHTSFQTDAQLKADGTPDNRFLTKIHGGLPPRQGPVTSAGPTSATSTLGFSIYPSSTSNVPVIRNEELILINAETKLGLGDAAGAIAALNITRVNSGGLPPSTLTPASPTSQILDQILYEKRYSLMYEGIRWVDMRKYGRLNQLPLDVASGPNKNFVAPVLPIPQSECLVRAKLSGIYLGPNNQNNCAP